MVVSTADPAVAGTDTVAALVASGRREAGRRRSDEAWLPWAAVVVVFEADSSEEECSCKRSSAEDLLGYVAARLLSVEWFGRGGFLGSVRLGRRT